LFIYGQSFTNPANFVKIGPVDVEIIGLIEITENTKKLTAAASVTLKPDGLKKKRSCLQVKCQEKWWVAAVRRICGVRVR